MKERVEVIYGTENFLFVAPHGHDLDDTNTGLIAEKAARECNGSAVINHGWRRSKTVDELQGLANCNNSEHCQESVVKAEFFDPICERVENMYNDFADAVDAGAGGLFYPYIFMIHGIGGGVRKTTGDPNLDIILGFGAGQKPHYTCQQWQREFFADISGFKTYFGAAGGAYSARSKTNMTQAIYRKYSPMISTLAVMQVEIIYQHRDTETKAENFGRSLGEYVNLLTGITGYSRTGGQPIPEI